MLAPLCAVHCKWQIKLSLLFSSTHLTSGRVFRVLFRRLDGDEISILTLLQQREAALPTGESDDELGMFSFAIRLRLGDESSRSSSFLLHFLSHLVISLMHCPFLSPASSAHGILGPARDLCAALETREKCFNSMQVFLPCGVWTVMTISYVQKYFLLLNWQRLPVHIRELTVAPLSSDMSYVKFSRNSLRSTWAHSSVNLRCEFDWATVQLCWREKEKLISSH